MSIIEDVFPPIETALALEPEELAVPLLECLCRHEIAKRNDDVEFMSFIFSVIVSFPTDRRCSHLTFFLEYNKEFDDFRELPLEPLVSGWSGSAVPMLQAKIDYYEKLLSVCNTTNLLKHKQYLEQQISYLRRDILQEKKNAFTEDFGIPLA
jgi:hypothetical protein